MYFCKTNALQFEGEGAFKKMEKKFKITLTISSISGT